jgi:hypothetical protein
VVSVRDGLDDARRGSASPAPDGKFSLYIRAYWPDKAIIDGSWMPEANAGGGTIGRQQ